MASPTSPPAAAAPGEDHGARRPRWALVATLAAVTVLLGGWIYVLFVYDPGLMIDELADRKFPTAAEQVCAAAEEQLAELPPAELAASPSERADVVARTNMILTQMITDLRPLAPTEPPQAASGVEEWLDDWMTYIGNRERYVESLRVDPEARFLESTKGSDTKGISRAINGFALVNRMDSCTTPADLS